MKKFPKTIYVTRENEGTDDEYFNVHTDVEDSAFEETTVVAVYDLTNMGRVEVRRELQWGSATKKQSR